MSLLSRKICGIDEAGRGPLAGPVVAAAVILPSWPFLPGIRDSKTLTFTQRERLYQQIHSVAEGIGIGIVSPQEIDRMNILEATQRAMEMALAALDTTPDLVLVDGNRVPPLPYPHRAVVDGDTLCYLIAAASIVAKVFRDRLMLEYDLLYPQYGFARHKGYGTPEHLRALQEYGPCPIHRRSFRGVTTGKGMADAAEGAGQTGRRDSGSLFTGTGV